jgi:hypothetical protein
VLDLLLKAAILVSSTTEQDNDKAPLLAAAQNANENFNTASVELDWGTLYCSVRKRASNSRGPKRGQHYVVEFNFRASDKKYSKKISKAKALELLGE